MESEIEILDDIRDLLQEQNLLLKQLIELQLTQVDPTAIADQGIMP